MHAEKLIQPYHDLPLNQAAKRLLSKAGEQPFPNYLYSLQLMTWALEGNQHGLGLGKLGEARRERLEQVVNDLAWEEPAFAMKYLAFSGQEVSVRPEELRGTPLEAAQVLLQAAHRQHLAQNPTYQ